MSTQPADFEVRERQPRHLVATVPPSLDELATTANREHELCEQASASALEHAIAAGEALAAARSVVETGAWLAWLGANFEGCRSTANHYQRFHKYRDELRAGMGIGEARDLLRGRPDVAKRGLPALPTEVRNEAVRLVREERLPVRDVAARLDISRSTVNDWLDPKRASEKRTRFANKRKAANAALAKVEREKAIRAAVRKAGAGLSEAYSMSARMAKVLAQAEAEATTDEARAALADATAHYHRMSDAIVLALGVSS